ncbi:MAG: hypothetical protein JW903_00850, partial [Clostridia bacterium]|nr:hypothetical protein [Clostridia bacterium]
KLCSKGLLMPVNEFIADIPGYSDLPNEILEGYTDKDGNIWALPTGRDIALPRRIYNKEWLDAYGEGEPSNLDEFIEFARFIAYADPDGNGVDDTYIAAYSPRDILRSLGDIFTHLGCRQVGYYPIGYDPDTEKFINVCETAGFSEAMAAIKMMVEEGLLIEDSRWSYILEEPESFEYRVASVMGMAYYPEYFNGCVIGSYWSGTDGKASVPIWVEHMGLAVLRDTMEVAAKFNTLYEIAASGSNGYMDLMAGMEGKQYEIKEKQVIYRLASADGEDNPMVGLNMQIALDKGKSLEIVYNGNEQNLEMHESGRVVVDEIREKNAAFLSSPNLFVVPFVKEGYKLWNLRLYIMNPFIDLVSNIVHSYNSLEMAVHSYNQKLQADGVYDILEEINGGVGD